MTAGANPSPAPRRLAVSNAAAGSAPADGPLRALFDEAAAPRASEGEVAWYRAMLPRNAGMLLQVFAGHGRLLIPLLDAGFTLHGVDPSAACLARCAARLDATGHRAELFRQEPTALNLPFRYAAAFFAAGSFQRLTGRLDALDALLRIRAHLIDPGLLLLDLIVPGQAAHPPGAPVVELSTLAMPDGSQIARRSETAIDAGGRLSAVRSRFERRDRTGVSAREDDVRESTWYAKEEIVALVGNAGYRHVRCRALRWRDARDGGRADRFAVSARA